MSSGDYSHLFVIGAIPKCQPDDRLNPGDKYTPEGVGVGVREEVEFSSMRDAIIYAMSKYIIPEEWRKGYEHWARMLSTPEAIEFERVSADEEFYPSRGGLKYWSNFVFSDQTLFDTRGNIFKWDERRFNGVYVFDTQFPPSTLTSACEDLWVVNGSDYTRYYNENFGTYKEAVNYACDVILNWSIGEEPGLTETSLPAKINYLFDETSTVRGCVNIESAIEALGYDQPHIGGSCYGPHGFVETSVDWLFIIKLESKCDTRKSRCSKKGCPKRIFRKVKWELMDTVLAWYNHSHFMNQLKGGVTEKYRDWWEEEERKEGLEELAEFEIELLERRG